MFTIKSLFNLYSEDNFLKRLLTFRSVDKVQREIADKNVNISLDDVQKIGKIVCDLEKNEENLLEEDLNTIYNADNYIDENSFFNPDLYNLFYNRKSQYPSNFFLNKDYYDGEIISTGIFTIACKMFKLKKQYLKNKGIWDINIYE